MDLNKAIQNRHSTRKFNSKRPNWRDIIECIDAARYAPMAGNNFTLKFILVGDENKIQAIADACQQPFVGQAKYIVVVCSSPDRIINAYGDTGKVFARQQAGATIENFLLKIEEKKLATCWIGYFSERLVKEILKIPNNVNVEALFPVGYPYDRTYKKRQKAELDTYLHFNAYGERYMNSEKKMEV